jgi:hypothetical protein
VRSLHYDLTNKFTDVLKCTTAIQVAVFELANEDWALDVALPALERCIKELGIAVKALKKSLNDA